MNRFRLSLYLFFLTVFSLYFFQIPIVLGQFGSKESIIHDETMIVPGLGSNGIVIGEDIDAVIRRFGKQKFRISKPNHVSELFKNVFKIVSDTKIYFDTIYYNDEQKCAACVFQGKVIAVIGFDTNRVTIDAVNLQSGINNFIFNYGNKNSKVLRSGTNGIYIYRDIGIAVVDDDMNDSIDLYIIFVPPFGKNK
jgi:hypothetical protein